MLKRVENLFEYTLYELTLPLTLPQPSVPEDVVYTAVDVPQPWC